MLNPVSRKILTILFLGALLAVALRLIHGIVVERQARQQEVEAGIAAGSGGRQSVVGPLLLAQVRDPPSVIPAQAGKPATVGASTVRLLHVLPDTLEVAGAVEVRPRHRGIYRAQTFRLDGTWQGRFRVPARFGLPAQSGTSIERVFVAFAVADPRGLRGRPALRLDGRAQTLAAGTSVPVLGDGFRVELDPAALAAGGDLGFALQLSLEGTGSLSVVPSGDDTRIALRSNWPHPSFEGAFLPGERSLAADGFSATWQTTLLATNLDGRLAGCLQRGTGPCELPGIGVRFVEPVNVYQRSERAVKYGLLFIGLTFGAFFLFETLKRCRMHPLQYAFVGLALALFFLLVISLSEHVAFALAYGAAATACVLLVTVYLRYVLGGWRRALGLGALLALLYGVLYGLLVSEDNSLVLGSVLLFALLAAAMWLTRRVDWYTAGEARRQPADAA